MLLSFFVLRMTRVAYFIKFCADRYEEAEWSINMSEKKRNLIVICSDEHNPAMCGYRGHPTVKTPNLDALANDGTDFTKAYCNSPVCTPSRMSFITGKYPFQVKSWFMGMPLDDKESTWARRLTQAGIPSTMYGKLDLCGPYQSAGFSDYKILHRRPSWAKIPREIPFDTRLVGYRRKGKWEQIVNAGSIDDIVEDTKQGQNKIGHYNHDRQVTDWSLEYIKDKGQTKNDEPWALYIGLLYPHWPFRVPKKYYDMYYPNVEMPRDFKYPNENLHSILQEFQKGVAFEGINEEHLRKVIAAYYGMITCMDDMIGEIINELKEQGLYDNTNIIYTSDHGESLGEHGLFFKQCTYEASIGVPLLVSGPDYPKNQKISTPVSLVDMYPTIMDMMGLETEVDRVGQSWLPLINGENRENPFVFAEYHGNFLPQDWYMLLDEKYKYTKYQNREPSLFDVLNDPYEMNDLAKSNSSEIQKIISDMDKRMQSIADTEAISLECKTDMGLIGENGEDYTETLTADELKAGIASGRFNGEDVIIRSVNGRFIGEY